MRLVEKTPSTMYSTLESEDSGTNGAKIPPRGEVGAVFEYTHMLGRVGKSRAESIPRA